MVTLGYTLSCEENDPASLLEHAARAEQCGFEFATVSDHYHPWIDKQGNSPFVWSVLGGLAERTESLRIGTGVTCPIIRIHPAIVAQAAATAATMLPDRFFLGVGTGENLNEHVTGEHWPPFPVRLEMLEEAIEILRRLWDGTDVSYDGEHYTVENARLYTVPDDPPPIHVAAGGESMATAAGRLGDGLVSTAPDAGLVDRFEETADGDEPRYGQIAVCWADSEAAARQTALEWWPNTALPGELAQELPTPAHFEQACTLVDEADVAERIVCGPDSQAHVDAIQEYVDAGFDHVSVHQVGPEQDGFFDAYEREVLPAFE